MKLCRFELSSSPGDPRSGIVYGGKVYETQGAEGVGIHEASDVRLLTPVGVPPSIRLFGPPEEGSEWESGGDVVFPPFVYANPASLHGPTDAVLTPEYAKTLLAEPYLAMVIGGAGLGVDVLIADDVILGLSLMWVIRGVHQKGGRARDAGVVLGPAITTPDELDDAVTVDERGRRYRFHLSVRKGGEELGRFDLNSLPYTLAELVSHASESCPLKQGDLIAVPVHGEEREVSRGDEFILSSDKIGLLAVRLV